MPEIDIPKSLNEAAVANPQEILKKIQDYLMSIDEPDQARRAVTLLGLEDGAAFYDVVLSNFTFATAKPVLSPTLTVTRDFINDSSAQISDTFVYSKSLQESQTFTFTEGLTVGTKATAKVGLPLFGEASVDVSAEVSFGATQSFGTTTTQSWSQSSTINVPPHSTVEAIGFVKVATNTNRSFTGNATVTGGTFYYFLSATTDPKTKYLSTNSWYLEIPISAILAPSQTTFPLAGSWSGSLGVSVIVRAHDKTSAS